VDFAGFLFHCQLSARMEGLNFVITLMAAVEGA